MGGNHHHRRGGPPNEEALKRLAGYEAREREASIPTDRWDEEVERALEIGLPGADSIEDETISTFARTELPRFAEINTFMRFPFLEDVRSVADHRVRSFSRIGARHPGEILHRP
ncbi:hypothetical protein BH24ACT22_BH24ACT22_18510 [soil metagenome]